MQLHRVIGGAHVFLVFVAAIGLSGMWRMVTARTNLAVAAIVTIVVYFRW